MHRFIQSTFLSTAILTICCSPTIAQSDPAPGRSSESINQLLVVPLVHAAAEDAIELVANLTDFDKVRMTVDLRTNSVILTGEREDLNVIVDIIKQIDVPLEDPRTPKHSGLFRSYQVASPELTQQSLNILQTLFAGQNGVRMDIDRSDSKLFVYGTEADQNMVKNLLNEMQPADSEVVGGRNNFHVSAVFVVESNQIEEANRLGLKSLNPSTAKVVTSANQKGLLDFENPMVAARVTSLVQSKLPERELEIRSGRSVQRIAPNRDEAANGDGAFENSSRSRNNGFFLNVNGRLIEQLSEQFRLEAEFYIGVPTADGDNESAKLSTSIQLPVDHPVLLSFSTVGGVDSALILSVSRQ